MTAPNNNYVVAAQNLDNDNAFYQAAAAAPFNPAGDFAAFVLFWLDGTAQSQAAENADSADIWGNAFNAGNDGWSIEIDPGGGALPGAAVDMVLVATVGDGAARVRAAFPLSLSTVGAGVMPSYINRLILAGLWYDSAAQTVWLSVNGSLQPPSAALAGAYSPSANAPSLGRSNLSGTGQGVSIVAAGFSPAPAAFPLASNAGGLAAENFVKSREALDGHYLYWIGGLDWVHRYQFSSALTQGTIATSPTGPVLQSFPALPASLPDLGGLGPTNATTPGLGANPVALNRVDDVLANSWLVQNRNPDWYSGGAFQFLGP